MSIPGIDTVARGAIGQITLTQATVQTPPFRCGGPVALLAEAVGIAQPDPWTYAFFGALQPFAAKTLSPQLAAVSANNPPFSVGGPVVLPASLAEIAQPDSWTFSFLGAQQPFGARTLSPGIPGQSLQPPPYDHAGRSALMASLVSVWQPDPWSYTFDGAQQPFAPRVLPYVVTNISQPPFSDAGRGAIAAQLIALTQPDPRTYSFFGTSQPFRAKNLSPGIPGQDIDQAPYVHPGRYATTAELITIWQPDPWTFAFFGAGQPFGAKTISPGIPGQDRDNPPFMPGGPAALKLQLVGQQQPDPWTYSFFGGAAPFLPRPVDADLPGRSVNQPPFNHPSRAAATIAIRSAWDPPPPDYQICLYARIPVEQGGRGIYFNIASGAFTVTGITALFSVTAMAASGTFLETGYAATLTRDFLNWLPARPLGAPAWSADSAPAGAVWTPSAGTPTTTWTIDASMSIPPPEQE